MRARLEFCRRYAEKTPEWWEANVHLWVDDRSGNGTTVRRSEYAHSGQCLRSRTPPVSSCCWTLFLYLSLIAVWAVQEQNPMKTTLFADNSGAAGTTAETHGARARVYHRPPAGGLMYTTLLRPGGPIGVRKEKGRFFRHPPTFP